MVFLDCLAVVSTGIAKGIVKEEQLKGNLLLVPLSFYQCIRLANQRIDQITIYCMRLDLTYNYDLNNND